MLFSEQTLLRMHVVVVSFSSYKRAPLSVSDRSFIRRHWSVYQGAHNLDRVLKLLEHTLKNEHLRDVEHTLVEHESSVRLCVRLGRLHGVHLYAARKRTHEKLEMRTLATRCPNSAACFKA